MSQKGSEDTVTTLLENEIKQLGVKVEAFTVLRTPTGIRKPDLLCEDGGKYPVEAKLTERDYLQAIAKIENDYLKYYKQLGIKGGFAVLYPVELSEPMSSEALTSLASKSKFKLLSLFPPDDPRPFKVYEQSLAEIAKTIAQHVLVPTQRIEPSVDYIIKSLREAAQYVVNGLRHVKGAELESFFGGKNVFKNILEYEEGAYPEEDLRSAAAYLLINQLLFYQVIARVKPEFIEIDGDSLKRPSDVNDYFAKVLDVNYKVVFSYDVASLIPKEYTDQVRTIISVIKGLSAEKVGGDLLGTIFHDLIPFEVRKNVAAFYTNVLAAELLASLAIDKSDARVVDFALGSGGLLVASYRRKKRLLGSKFNEASHQKFLGSDLLGVDVMPFAANIAACHLAIQAPQYFSDKVQIAVWDSTDLAPNKVIPSVARIDTVLTGQTSLKSFTEETSESKGVVSLRETKSDEINLGHYDVAIMNPPFTRQERLPERYKEILIDRFEKYQDFIHGQLGLYGYFVLLADKFLHKSGKMALVLPASVLRLQSCEGIRQFWADKYDIDYLITSEYRSAFSESVRFREILLVAQKRETKHNVTTKIATLKKLPETLSESRDMAEALSHVSDDYTDDTMTVRLVDYEELKDDTSNWFKLIAVRDLELPKFFALITKGSKFTELSEVAETIRGYELMGGEANSLIVNSKEERAIKSSDIWILSKADQKKIKFHYKGSDRPEFVVPLSATRRTLRRPSGVNKIDISHELDYVIVESWDTRQFDSLREVTSSKLSRSFMSKFKNDVEQRLGNFFIVRRLNLSAPQTYSLAFYSGIECSPTKLVWSASLPKQQAKLLAAYFNSTINILQTLLSRAETEGAFLDLSQYVLVDFLVPVLDMLSEKDTQNILIAFDKMSKHSLPSLLDQLKDKDPARVALDTAWLKAFNYQGDIKKRLNWLYRSLANEIETLKGIMGEGTEEE
ncbi:MAG: N-6 DNA methylase [archaeon]|nr:N-6 DNA methylase [archaeon]